MEFNPTLSEEKLKRYREANLTDSEIAILNTPFSQLTPEMRVYAFHAREKLDKGGA